MLEFKNKFGRKPKKIPNKRLLLESIRFRDSKILDTLNKSIRN